MACPRLATTPMDGRSTAKQSPSYRLVGPGLTLSTPTTTVLLREDSA